MKLTSGGGWNPRLGMFSLAGLIVCSIGLLHWNPRESGDDAGDSAQLEPAATEGLSEPPTREGAVAGFAEINEASLAPDGGLPAGP